MTPRVEVQRASLAQEPLLAAMLPGYLHELGVDCDLYPYLALYWVEEGRHPYLIRVDGQVAGFALVRRLSEQGLWELAEFYVAGALRRRGVGRSAAWALFAEHPGAWQLNVLTGNRDALAFWLRVVPRGTVPLPVDDPQAWPHLRFRFRVG
ncbi:GNAT family N-acetyltransferase [Pseudomonas citronellolis]|uniref:GNAT family N-acetyltransferase n=1 Tax=Pseudomonas citronellolis TaxID=53408 RepID=UPI0023E3755D|nr:GNAT family N-acetyltransferase [Pseudomonas citronellolis]MDF3935796.1 GNAT family N-acetyltransferase [Pseudomonas citronellolis]